MQQGVFKKVNDPFPPHIPMEKAGRFFLPFIVILGRIHLCRMETKPPSFTNQNKTKSWGEIKKLHREIKNKMKKKNRKKEKKRNTTPFGFGFQHTLSHQPHGADAPQVWSPNYQHIRTANWTPIRHPKVKSYLHACEKIGRDADGPYKLSW